MIKEFAIKHKKLIGVALLVAAVLAGLTATGKDDAIVADIKTMVESLQATDETKLEIVK